MKRVLFAMLLAAGGAAAQEPATAITVLPIEDARFVVGDDGKAHVDYDLIVTNVYAGPVTLERIEFFGPDEAVIGRLEGEALAAATQALLTGAPVMPVPASGSVAVTVDLVLEPDAVPDEVWHRVTYATGPDDPLAAMLDGRTVEGEVGLDGRRATTILSPLEGPGWLALNGCCAPNLHRSLRIGAGTHIAKPELFAIDWVRLDDDGRFFDRAGTANADYPYRGTEVRSVADGTVVAVHDGMDESVPFEPPSAIEAPDDYGGNWLMIEIEPGVFAFYAHLQPGSPTVGVGDRVTAGQVLGRLGNSGNSTFAHLHFGLLDAPDFLTGNSLPFVIEDFEVTGTITGGDATGLEVAPQARPVARGYPLVGTVATFR